MPKIVPLRGGWRKNFVLPFLGIDFFKSSWVVIHFQSSLVEYSKKGVTSCQHQLDMSKKSWSNLPKNILNCILAKLRYNLSTQTCVIHPNKAMESSKLLSFSYTSVRVKYCNPTVYLRKVPINSPLNCTKPYLNSLKYPPQATHLETASFGLLYKTNPLLWSGWSINLVEHPGTEGVVNPTT